MFSCDAAEESILIATPVEGTFETTEAGGAGSVTHYILSIVPRDEIFKPVDGMADLIQDSTTQVKGGAEGLHHEEAKSKSRTGPHSAE